MAKERATFTLDVAILRAARNATARTGRPVSEIVGDALRNYLAIGVLEGIRRNRSAATPEVADAEALRLARDEQHDARSGR